MTDKPLDEMSIDELQVATPGASFVAAHLALRAKFVLALAQNPAFIWDSMDMLAAGRGHLHHDLEKVPHKNWTDLLDYTYGLIGIAELLADHVDEANYYTWLEAASAPK